MIPEDTGLATRRTATLFATSAGPVLLLRPETRIRWETLAHALPTDPGPFGPGGPMLPSRASLSLEAGSISLLADDAPSPTAWTIHVPQGSLIWETGYLAVTVDPAGTRVTAPPATRVRWLRDGESGRGQLLPAGFHLRIGFLADHITREPIEGIPPVAARLRQQADRIAVADSGGQPTLRLTYPAHRFTRRPLQPDRLDPPAWTPILLDQEAPPPLPLDLDP